MDLHWQSYNNSRFGVFSGSAEAMAMAWNLLKQSLVV
jgi:hypothetical protein